MHSKKPNSVVFVIARKKCPPQKYAAYRRNTLADPADDFAQLVQPLVLMMPTAENLRASVPSQPR